MLVLTLSYVSAIRISCIKFLIVSLSDLYSSTASAITCGLLSSPACISLSRPSIHQFKMPLIASCCLNLAFNDVSCSLASKCLSNGISLTLPDANKLSSSTCGKWLVFMNILNCGLYSKEFWCRYLAHIVSLPVRAFTKALLRYKSLAGSLIFTNLAPLNLAISSLGAEPLEKDLQAILSACAVLP